MGPLFLLHKGLEEDTKLHKENASEFGKFASRFNKSSEHHHPFFAATFLPGYLDLYQKQLLCSLCLLGVIFHAPSQNGNFWQVFCTILNRYPPLPTFVQANLRTFSLSSKLYLLWN